MINTTNLTFEAQQAAIRSADSSGIAGWYQRPQVSAEGGLDLSDATRGTLARMADVEILNRAGAQAQRDSILVHRLSWYSALTLTSNLLSAVNQAAGARHLYVDLDCRHVHRTQDVQYLKAIAAAIREAGAGICLSGIEAHAQAQQLIALRPDLVRVRVGAATPHLIEGNSVEWLATLASARCRVLVGDKSLTPADRQVAALLGARLFLSAGQAHPAAECRSPAPRASGVGAGAAVAAMLLAAACSSTPPRPATPDGTIRVPVNQSARIAEFEAAAASSSTALRERDELHKRVAELTSQVSKLSQALAIMAASEAQDPRLDGRASLRPVQVQGSFQWQGLNAEPKANALVVREFFPTGVAAFKPSPEQAAALLEAARQATVIHIRGRTDSYVDDAANRAVAAARAKAARTWLIANGVPASKVKATWEASGDFLAENESNAGRNMNRRVELEFVGVALQGARPSNNQTSRG